MSNELSQRSACFPEGDYDDDDDDNDDDEEVASATNHDREFRHLNTDDEADDVIIDNVGDDIDVDGEVVGGAANSSASGSEDQEDEGFDQEVPEDENDDEDENSFEGAEGADADDDSRVAAAEQFINERQLVSVTPSDDDVDDEEDQSNEEFDDEEERMPDNVAGVYSPLIKRRRKQEIEITGLVPLPARIIGGVHDQSEVAEKSKTCSCRKSNCLKLFCECFASGMHCSEYCNCASCKNDGTPNHEPFRNEAILVALELDSNAFRYPPRRTGTSTSLVQNDAKNSKQSSCSCKKSRCLKKYCECFQSLHYCTVACRCSDCSNLVGCPEIEIIMAERRASDVAIQSASARPEPSDEKERAVAVVPTKANKAEIKASEAIVPAATGTSVLVTSGDMRLPPSAKTIAMKSRGGTAVAALAFGISKPRMKNAPDNSKSGSLRRPEIEQARSTSDSDKNDASVMQRAGSFSGTELERSWKQETEFVRTTFDAIRTELQSRKRGFQPSGPPHSATDERTAKRASRILESVEHDLIDIVQAVKATETHLQGTLDSSQVKNFKPSDSLRHPVDSRTEEKDEASSSDDDDDASQLMCNDELLARNGPGLSEYAARELTILAAQDAALMRELAKALRKSAVKLAERRMQSTNNS